jgi:hypothetical protein
MNFGENNVAMADRTIRIAIALILFAFIALKIVSGWLLYLVFIIGLILLITGIVGTCPLYSMFGMSTATKKN